MNQTLNLNTQRRVSTQTHLKAFFESTYEGFPVLQQPEGLVEAYLQGLSKVLRRSVEFHGRVFACRVDLHYPQLFHPVDGCSLSNQCFHKFIRTLARRLKAYKANKEGLGLRVHSVEFDYVWAREYSSTNIRPHYHLLLLFNGHTFNTLGHFSPEYESLYNRIAESWAEALGCHVSEGGMHLHIPDSSQYLVQAGSLEQYSEVFRRASYLTKVATKNFHDGYHVFGGSRV